MQLIPDFEAKFHKLWSVRLNAISLIVIGVEAILPVFDTAMPQWLYSALLAATTIGAIFARAYVQQNLMVTPDAANSTPAPK